MDLHHAYDRAHNMAYEWHFLRLSGSMSHGIFMEHQL